MRYHSSRGLAPAIDFGDALLGGLAPDGGLYLPEAWPRLPDAAPDSYPELAAAVMAPFVAPTIEQPAYPLGYSNNACRGARSPLFWALRPGQAASPLRASRPWPLPSAFPAA